MINNVFSIHGNLLSLEFPSRFAAANNGYNVTTSLCDILEPKVLTIIFCFVLNAKRKLGRDLWD